MTYIGATRIALEAAAGEAGEAVVTVDGTERWRYAYGARRRPFIHPLTTPAGHVLTRDAPDDHPWHHGLWFAIKFVNGENFWEEYDEYGVVHHVATPKVEHDGPRQSVVGALEWIRPDRETVVIREDRRLTFVPIDDDSYAIDLVTTLTPEADVVLDRTPFTTWGGYGGLAFRGRADLHDTRILLADGLVRDRVLGERAPWLDLSGLVGGADGEAAAGIAVFDPVGNPGHPVPWYGSTRADTYGDEGWSNFFNAAFLWDGPVAVARHEPLSLRYRVVVHDGLGEADRLHELYNDYRVELAESRL
jgi:hypothetical protein